MRSSPRLLATVLLPCLGSLVGPLAPVAAAERPNLVVIVADDLGYADVLFNPLHPPEVTTPHLDTLAKSGVICRQGYVTGHVCSPGKLKPGESQAVVSSLDILPTALAAAGLPAPTDKPLDGMNLLPVLLGETAPKPRRLFWSAGSDEGWWAVRSGDWKLVGEKAKVSLFDLSKDVSEKNDLATTMPEKVTELTKLHDAWLAEMPNPIKAGGKRYGMEAPAGTPPRKAKADRKKKNAAAP
jgi:arylsulfatase A-like enzyme